MTLRELVEACSEHAASTFDPAKPMMMYYMCENRDGSLAVYAGMVANAKEELIFRELLPLTFADKGITRYCFYTEAWMTVGKPTRLPRDDPSHNEMILFHAVEIATGDTLGAKRQIYRPAIGGGKLMPLVFDQPGTAHVFMMDVK